MAEQRKNLWATTGRTFPRVKAAKRIKKDEDNQWQRAMAGHGPAKTRKG